MWSPVFLHRSAHFSAPCMGLFLWLKTYTSILRPFPGAYKGAGACTRKHQGGTRNSPHAPKLGRFRSVQFSLEKGVVFLIFPVKYCIFVFLDGKFLEFEKNRLIFCRNFFAPVDAWKSLAFLHFFLKVARVAGFFKCPPCQGQIKSRRPCFSYS